MFRYARADRGQDTRGIHRDSTVSVHGNPAAMFSCDSDWTTPPPARRDLEIRSPSPDPSQARAAGHPLSTEVWAVSPIDQRIIHLNQTQGHDSQE